METKLTKSQAILTTQQEYAIKMVKLEQAWFEKQEREQIQQGKEWIVLLPLPKVTKENLKKQLIYLTDTPLEIYALD